jgi:hypothetical protein
MAARLYAPSLLPRQGLGQAVPFRNGAPSAQPHWLFSISRCAAQAHGNSPVEHPTKIPQFLYLRNFIHCPLREVLPKPASEPMGVSRKQLDGCPQSLTPAEKLLSTGGFRLLPIEGSRLLPRFSERDFFLCRGGGMISLPPNPFRSQHNREREKTLGVRPSFQEPILHC